MSVIELLASKTIDQEEWRLSDIEDARCEHSAHIEEVGEVVCRIEWLMRDAMNAGLSPTGPEVGALQSIIDSYRVTATMVAARILEKKLENLK